MSFQKLGRRRTSVMENGSAFHLTFATAAWVSEALAVSIPLEAAGFLSATTAPAFEGRRVKVPAAAALPRKCLRVSFWFMLPHFVGRFANTLRIQFRVHRKSPAHQSCQ